MHAERRGPYKFGSGPLRVLPYLPMNLSRLEIAELSVSVNTVSTHIRSIYAKLGADDRSAAVRRARELQLLAAVRSKHHVRRANAVIVVAALVPGRC
jgi:hypothetical protein